MSETFKIGDPVIYRGKTYSFPGHVCGITDDGQYIVRAIGAPDGSFAGMKHIYGAAQLETRDEAPAPQTHVMGSDALRLVIEYDTLLRKYQGDEDVILFDGDIVEVDDAYDRMVEAARSALAKPSEPSKEQIERAIEAYREGGYLNDEQVYASVTAIVRAALSAEVEG